MPPPRSSSSANWSEDSAPSTAEMNRLSSPALSAAVRASSRTSPEPTCGVEGIWTPVPLLAASSPLALREAATTSSVAAPHWLALMARASAAGLASAASVAITASHTASVALATAFVAPSAVSVGAGGAASASCTAQASTAAPAVSASAMGTVSSDAMASTPMNVAREAWSSPRANISCK